MTMRSTLRTAAILAAATIAAAITACSSATTPRTATTPAAHTTPVTATAARAAATRFFALYSAGQYAATWGLLTPTAKSAITRQVWTRAHQQCTSAATGLAYTVGKPILTGKTAVMKVSLAGAGSALGSEEITFTYTSGGWRYQPSDLALYRGSIDQVLTALKTAGYCS